MLTPLQQHLARRLADSIDRLHKEVEQVELWASAVSGFTQPVPDYDPRANVVVGAPQIGATLNPHRHEHYTNPHVE